MRNDSKNNEFVSNFFFFKNIKKTHENEKWLQYESEKLLQFVKNKDNEK